MTVPTLSIFDDPEAPVMAHYQRAGNVPAKRHTRHRDEAGRLYYEELMGEEGFSTDSSLLYHTAIPSAIVDARTWDLPDPGDRRQPTLKPRHLNLHVLFAGEEWKSVDAVTGRRLVLGNADVRIAYAAVGAEGRAQLAVAVPTSPFHRPGCVRSASATGHHRGRSPQAVRHHRGHRPTRANLGLRPIYN